MKHRQVAFLFHSVKSTNINLYLKAFAHVVQNETANKFFFYVTWLGFVMPHVDVLVTVLFLTLSVCLWYNFFKTWKGDPGCIKVTEDQRFRAIVELAERSNDKNPFDQRIFCVTCLVKRPLRLVSIQKH